METRPHTEPYDNVTDRPPDLPGPAALTRLTDDLPALLSVPLAGRILGLSRASAYRYAAGGYLPVKRFGGRIFVVTAQLRTLLDGAGELVA